MSSHSPPATSYFPLSVSIQPLSMAVEQFAKQSQFPYTILKRFIQMEQLETPPDLIIPEHRVRVGVAQYCAVGFDLEASLVKLEKVVEDAAARDVKFLLFPEAYLSGYPFLADVGGAFSFFTMKGRKIYQLAYESAVEVPGPVITRLSSLAKENGIFLVVGVIEKEATSSSMYCTIVFIKEDGTYLGKHRKLLPTMYERFLWARGDGSTMPVFDTFAGKVGAVTCWENYVPLMRAAMYSKGIQIYCAPTIDPTDRWTHSMHHIAAEGRCFVLSCNQFARRSDFPPDSIFPHIIKETEGDTILNSGGSVIISPSGQVLAGPNFTSEELLIADIDLNEGIRAKYDLDCAGDYSRPDIFTLYVNERPNPGTVIESLGKVKLNRDKDKAEHQECTCSRKPKSGKKGGNTTNGQDFGWGGKGFIIPP